MDNTKFTSACDIILHQAVQKNTIGTLSEKSVHAVLKEYFSCHANEQEQRLENYIVDILHEDHITEIQTKNFRNLRNKLDAFLDQYLFTVVFPITNEKQIFWINEETGEVSKPRKSTKKGSPAQIFSELYQIKSYLLHPHLMLHIVLLDVEEYRLLNGYSKDKKKGATSCDMLPRRLINEYVLKSPMDYVSLLPSTLPKQFTSAQLKKAAHISNRTAWAAIKIMSDLNVIKQVGKQGRAYLYEIL